MRPSKSRTLIDKEDIRIIQAKLATEIGINENIFLQQIHYWLKGNEERDHNYKDGRYWTYNTYADWKEKCFPFWSTTTIKRISDSLKKQGLIETTSKYNKKDYDNTLWYTINYEKLREVEIKAYNLEQEEPSSQPEEAPSDQSEETPSTQVGEGTTQVGEGCNQSGQTNTKELSLDLPKNLNNNNNNNNATPAENKSYSQPNLSDKVFEVFEFSFGKKLRPIQLKKLESLDMSPKLIASFIQTCGLAGHNESFMFEGFRRLEEEGVKTAREFKLKKDNPSEWKKYKQWDKFDFTSKDLEDLDDYDLCDDEKEENKDEQTITFDIEVQKEFDDPTTKEEVAMLWNKFINIVQRELSKDSYKTWFSNVKPIVKENEFIILAKNDFISDWLESKYSELIKNTIHQLTGIEYSFIYTSESKQQP